MKCSKINRDSDDVEEHLIEPGSSLYRYLESPYEPELSSGKETLRSKKRKNKIFEPRLVENDFDDIIISFTDLDDQFRPSVHIFNISTGQEVASLGGA